LLAKKPSTETGQPQAAYRALLDKPDLLDRNLANEVLQVIGETRELAAAEGIPEPVERPAPIPTSEAGIDAEYQALIGQSAATGKLTAAEGARLQALAEAKVAAQDRQTAAAEATSGTKPAPDE